MVYFYQIMNHSAGNDKFAFLTLFLSPDILINLRSHGHCVIYGVESWSGGLEWSLGVEPWSGVLEWILEWNEVRF